MALFSMAESELSVQESSSDIPATQAAAISKSFLGLETTSKPHEVGTFPS